MIYMTGICFQLTKHDMTIQAEPVTSLGNSVLDGILTAYSYRRRLSMPLEEHGK